MNRRRPRMIPAAILFGLVVGVAVACNVFGSLDRCASDADCLAGAVCDPAGRFCSATDGGREAVTPEAGVDAPTDVREEPDAAPPAPCELGAPFSIVTLVAGFESREISSLRFDPTEKTALFSATNGCPEEPCHDLFAGDRPDRTQPFGVVAPLPGVSCVGTADYWPTVSSDGTFLFFESGRHLDGGCTTDLARIWSASRSSVLGDFSPPRIQALFAGQDASEGAPYLHPSARSLYFTSGARPGKGGLDIFVAKLDALGIATTIENVEAVNTVADENMAVVSLDDTVLYLGRFGDQGTARDILVATRSSPSAKFGAAALVSELSTTTTDEYPSWISDDRCRLYFISNRPSATTDAAGLGAYHAWVAERPKAR